MSKFEGLSFAPCPVQAPADVDGTIKAAVLKSGAIKLTFTAGAYARLQKPEALSVECAIDADGRGFLRVAADRGGWPVVERDAPTSKKNPGGGRPSASCTIRVHPFTPRVVHGACVVEADWAGDAVMLAMPNWERMLDEFVEPPPADDADDEGG